MDCQIFKITRHVKNTPSNFVTAYGCFKHVHIDIVGHLSNSEGFSYLLTIVDKFSSSIEAVLMRDMTATTVTRAFFDT